MCSSHTSDSPKEGKHASGQVVIHGQGGHDEHRHRAEEESLRDKIRADHERALQEAKEKLRKSREELRAEIQTEKTKVVEDLKKKDPGPRPLPPVPMPQVVGVNDGEPPEPDVKEKRDKIRETRAASISCLWLIPLTPRATEIQIVESLHAQKH
ncbi:hypothetical protein NQD34_015736 [Periophthalmus magnuspinnatus]|nr:hypothetical protein NQD34_015736 [Periophthalmus magnuspinnatus]